MNIHFGILVSENRQLTDTIKNESWKFAPDGVDFYSFKIVRCLAIPQKRRRSKLSTFSFEFS